MLPKIANMTEAYLFDELADADIESMDWEHFGKAVKVEVDQYETKL